MSDTQKYLDESEWWVNLVWRIMTKQPCHPWTVDSLAAAKSVARICGRIAMLDSKVEIEMQDETKPLSIEAVLKWLDDEGSSGLDLSPGIPEAKEAAKTIRDLQAVNLRLMLMCDAVKTAREVMQQSVDGLITYEEAMQKLQDIIGFQHDEHMPCPISAAIAEIEKENK